MSGQRPSIALLGTGLMGFPMARNILKAGFALTAWNRTPDKAAGLQAFGANLAETAAEAASAADIVIAMVSDGPAVNDLLFGQSVASAMHSGALFIDMGSIRPAEARDHAERLKSLGIAALDAPVSGGTKGADAASLAIMAGGDADAFAQAEPVLRTMGRPVHVGPSGSGQIAKLANQGIVAVTIGAVAEAILLAESSGMAPGALRQALAGGFADSVILQQHGGRMEARDFVPGGRSSIQLKDLANLLDSAGELDLPLAKAMHERYAALVRDMGKGDLDHSALFLELLARNA